MEMEIYNNENLYLNWNMDFKDLKSHKTKNENAKLKHKTYQNLPNSQKLGAGQPIFLRI